MVLAGVQGRGRARGARRAAAGLAGLGGGVDEGTLRRWVQLERRRRAGDPDAPAPAARGGAGASDAARIRELERELREARQEAEFLKKAAAFFARDHR